MFVSMTGEKSVNFRKAVEKSKANPYNHKAEKQKSLKLLKEMLKSMDNSKTNDESNK